MSLKNYGKKICRNCGKEFEKIGTRQDYCKNCGVIVAKERRLKWQRSHRALQRQYTRKYYINHKDEAREYSLKNRKRINAYRRAYRASNKEKSRGSWRSYYAKNKDKINLFARILRKVKGINKKMVDNLKLVIGELLNIETKYRTKISTIFEKALKDAKRGIDG